MSRQFRYGAPATRLQHGASFNYLKKLTHDQDPSTPRRPGCRDRRRRLRADNGADNVLDDILERDDAIVGRGNSGDAGDSRHSGHARNAREPDDGHGCVAGHTGNARYTRNSGDAGPQGQRTRIGRIGDEVTR